MEYIGAHINIDDIDTFLATLNEIEKEFGIFIHTFDAQYIAGPRHIEHAIRLADRAIEREDAIARDRSIEVLCYAAGRRQINQALQLGVGSGEQDVIIAVEGEITDGLLHRLTSIDGFVSKTEPFTMQNNAQLQSFFDIPSSECSATSQSLESLVCERIALLTIEK